MSDIVAWECGSCKKTNDDMARRHCLIHASTTAPASMPPPSWRMFIERGAHDNFPLSAYGQKQKKEGRHQKIETLTGERTRNC